jgi:putative flippase GtrA
MSVGATGFLLQLATLATLTRLGVAESLAVAIAVEAAILQNFLWHERWTWQERCHGTRLDVVARFLRFNAASGAISLLGNVGFTMLFVEWLRMPVLVANTLAVGILSAANFVVADRFVFAPVMNGSQPGVSRTGARHRSQGLRAGWLGATRRAVAGSAFVVLMLGDGRVEAADIRKDTAEAWDRYVAEVENRLAREQKDPSRFLSVDFSPEQESTRLRQRLRNGEVIVQDVEMRSAKTIDVPGGMIHHWRGYVLIPGVTVDELVAAGKDPTGPRAPKQEDVLDSRVLSQSGDSLRLYLKLQRKNIVTVAYNTEHLVTYRKLGAGHASSRSISAKIAELENLGTAAEREKPIGQDSGFLWRLNSYWRYEAVPGGVVVELESLTLSRNIPLGFGTIVRPLVDRVARESVARTLDSMRGRFATNGN